MSAKVKHGDDVFELDIFDYAYPEPTSVRDVFLKTAERIDRYGLLRDDWGGLKVVETNRGNELVPCAGCLLAMLRIECGLQPVFDGYLSQVELEHEAEAYPRNFEMFDEVVAVLSRHVDLPVEAPSCLSGYDRVMIWSDSHGLKARDRWEDAAELTPEQFEEAKGEGTWDPVVKLLRELAAEA